MKLLLKMGIRSSQSVGMDNNSLNAEMERGTTAKLTSLAWSRLVQGNKTNPLSMVTMAHIPPPPVISFSPLPSPLKVSDPLYHDYFGFSMGLNYTLISPEEIQRLWNQVVSDSSYQSMLEKGRQSATQEKERLRKMELLLRAAMNSGNIDLAMLLMSGLASFEANQLTTSLMQRMQNLQGERRTIADDMAKLGTGASDAARMNSLNLKASDIGTEMNLLQTFLQDLTAQKREAQELASNYLHARHTTAQTILRNIG